MIDFYKFYNKNQVGADCAIVSALNASLYLHNKKLIKPGTKRYEKILKLTGCRYGSAISPEDCYPVLKIKVKKVYTDEQTLNYSDLPLELSIWHSHYGFHSVLIVDYCKKNKAVQVLNFRQEITTDGWIFIEKLGYFIKRSSPLEGLGIARSFETV